MPVDPQVIQRWTGSAPYWEKHRNLIRQMFDPITRTLADEAEMSRTDVVVDVATGSGEPALTLAENMARTVVGVDAIPGMAAAAHRAAGKHGAANAFFAAAFGDRLPFRESAFDAAVCRFALMFFPAPVEGIREILRVIKPGRRVAFAVWGTAKNNPFFTAVSEVLGRYVESPPGDPDAPDGFRFAPPGKLKALCGEAGAVEVSERVFQFPIAAPVSVEEFWDVRYEMSETLREKVTKLSGPQWPGVKRELLESVGRYAMPGGIRIPAEILIVSGRKPRG